MELQNQIHPFRKGLHRLSVIRTDLAEAESLIRLLADAEQKTRPREFAGKTSCVYYKMPYVPPYESFQELRKLILRIRENTGLRADFHGIVAIEATQWLSHEQEEYFTVLLKYLYDHRNLWQAALVLNHGTQAQCERFLSHCARYITPRFFDASLFTRQEFLCDTIRCEFARQGTPIAQDAADLLAVALARPELKDARSLTLIRRSAEETIACAGTGRPITREEIREYLENPYSTLTLMAGNPLTTERSNRFETYGLHL